MKNFFLFSFCLMILSSYSLYAKSNYNMDGELDSENNIIKEEFPVSNDELEKQVEKIGKNTHNLNLHNNNQKNNFTQKVLLLAINKITARSLEIKLDIGKARKFGNLTIIAHACWKAPLSKDPENKALLTILEKKTEKSQIKELFKGWMFSSSPSLSALEHPVYDINILRCSNN